MNILSLVLLAVSLSIDALGIGISYSIRKIKISFFPKTIISLISFLITYISISFGTFASKFIGIIPAKIIGSSMLILYGIITIYQGIKKEPKNYDLDSSKNIDLKESIYIGIALSIDSFAGGLSYSIAGYKSLLTPVFVGILQFLFLSTGLFLGNKILLKKSLSSKFISIISGTIFIILAFSKIIL